MNDKNSVNQSQKHSSGVAVESPQPPGASRQWIEEHYGPLTLFTQSVMLREPCAAIVSVVVAAVPVMGGVAVGLGTTDAYAIESLYGDLRRG